MGISQAFLPHSQSLAIGSGGSWWFPSEETLAQAFHKPLWITSILTGLDHPTPPTSEKKIQEAE